MRRIPQCIGFGVLLLATRAAAAPPDAEIHAFLHETTPANCTANSTWIDEPSANGAPNAIVIVTRRAGSGGTSDGHAVGVWYEATRGRWAVFNEDMAAMPEGIAFNVATASGPSAFVHRASAANTAGNSTYIDNALCNGQPSAALLVTPNWNPGGSGGVYDPHTIGVWYDTGRGRWAVFNQDMAQMPDAAAFNVVAGEATSYRTPEVPAGAGDAAARLFVTPNWNPDGKGGTYVKAPVGVAYGNGAWTVVTLDGSKVPPDAAWNVAALGAGAAKKGAPTSKQGGKGAPAGADGAPRPEGPGTTPGAAGVAPGTGGPGIAPGLGGPPTAAGGQGGAGPGAPDVVTAGLGGAATTAQPTDWDFENGAANWTRTGTAFANQPTAGDNVLAERVRYEMAYSNGGIGGDYWKRVPYPVGTHGSGWIGTYEDHRNASAPLGAVQGDAPTGTLTSPDFELDAAHTHIAFVVGGGADAAKERVELQVRSESEADAAALVRTILANRDLALLAIGLLQGTAPPPPVENGVGTRDGDYVVALSASGTNSEVMRPMAFTVPPNLLGRTGRIRIVDHSDGAWGHINADDFRFGAVRPHDHSPRVWGFADTHTHPVNDLAFGGNVVQGSLYARDGSSFESDPEHFRKTALPPVFESLEWSPIGPVSRLLTSCFFGGASEVPGMTVTGPRPGSPAGDTAREATRLLRSGYPEMQCYPRLSQMLGQQMYGEWIHRAYDGGLRLMSALAVNTWVVSSHPIKKAVLGSPQPEDDVGSANRQVEDVKTWTLRPENRGWVEVAYTPAEARRIISENKLAIVLGVELDLLGNFVPNDHWQEKGAVVMPADPVRQRALIGAELDRLYAQGVRQVGAFHYVSGVFGGCAMSQRLFNEVNRKVTGENVKVVSGDVCGIRYRLDMDAWDAVGAAGRTVVTGDLPPLQADDSWGTTELGHINAMGLSDAGAILFDEMARRGMLIDIDHASYRSTETLLGLATARRYPVLSSHTDFTDLGFTGDGDYSHGPLMDDDAKNLARFDTTNIVSLRHEGMTTRHKAETIASLRGTTGAIMWLPRRMKWGDAVPNDCEGSSKTWAQAYQYAVDVMGGHGVALSTDRVTLEPRFGPNAAYLLGLETSSMADRDQRRFKEVDAQSNGVHYDCNIKEWRAYRFASAAPVNAWQMTPVPGPEGWESRPWEHADAWMAIAAWSAGRNPRIMTTTHGIPASGDPAHMARIVNYAWGLCSETLADLESDCGPLRANCGGAALDERYAAYCAKKGITPEGIEPWPDHRGVWENFRWISRALEEWRRMDGRNEALRRHVFGERDFDVNLDGVAHYGMLPDFLQDVANSHSRPEEVGSYLSPLFRSAEDYIQMWEKCESAAGR